MLKFISEKCMDFNICVVVFGFGFSVRKRSVGECKKIFFSYFASDWLFVRIFASPINKKTDIK